MCSTGSAGVHAGPDYHLLSESALFRFSRPAEDSGAPSEVPAISR